MTQPHADRDPLLYAMAAYKKTFAAAETQVDLAPLLMRRFDGADRLSRVPKGHPQRLEVAAKVQRAVETGRRLEATDDDPR